MIRMSGDLIMVFRDRHNRRMSERFNSAWKAFVGVESLKPEQPPLQPSDPSHRSLEHSASIPDRYKDN